MNLLHSVGWFATTMLAAMAPISLHAEPAELGEVVHTVSGAVRGSPRDENGVLSFKGMPFAAPPVADLRWHAPEPVKPWTEVRDATKFGNRCLSALPNDPEPGPARSEDCLFLNIWTAAHKPAERRPVMVWIHGGGFQFGSGSAPYFNGTQLARKGVVLVTFNYRVGVLGHMAHPALDKEGASGNYGLQDQLAALHWVKANIARFGGDPDNVTLFGESAGAHAVGLLMTSPLSKGLFHKAIGQSGAFWDGKNGPMEGFDESRARGVAFMRKLGESSIAALRAMPAEKINAAAPWDFTMNPMVTVFSPNVDHHVLPDFPSARYARGEYMKIPLLAGWNEAEDYPFRAFSLPHGNAQEFRDAAARMFGKDRLAEFLALYPASTDAEAVASSNALTGDITISEQTWKWLEYQQAGGRVPVYGYKFTYTSPYVPIASHITEIPFVFGTLTPQFIIHSNKPPAEADRALAQTMMSYWVNFATRGNPNAAGLPIWPAYGDKGLIQNLGQVVAPQENAQAARFRFIASYRAGGTLPLRWRRDVP
ncbi:carboxylesterase family protein [Variovorax sp. dw_954]|uniref:carboxylesterase/lipase family protein n=1 Tax=Variovorax sp. dw_954 TaxID=2720078 RepID=UPI001BD34722|nr:carboxylesterase family protein [Variovorax sp. dw_954]